jgi:lipopolysaccharide/colanic/teichoic acid biosynthesis glycosyltransferase
VEPARKTGAVALEHDDVTPDHAGNADEPVEINEALNRLRPVTFEPTAYTRWVKPMLDRAAALIALMVFALPMLIIAVVVVVAMGRPVLFRQRRVGLNGAKFDVLKFRTMGHDRRRTEISVLRDHRLTHKSEKDPRHNRVGRVLRKYSLDELPQLINIVRGDMSLVGPRPELESVVSQHYCDYLHQRHLVKPGLTGLWQISARGSGPMHENGGWDLDYVEKISPLTDLAILCKTPFAMIGRNQGQ